MEYKHKWQDQASQILEQDWNLSQLEAEGVVTLWDHNPEAIRGLLKLSGDREKLMVDRFCNSQETNDLFRRQGALLESREFYRVLAQALRGDE